MENDTIYTLNEEFISTFTKEIFKNVALRINEIIVQSIDDTANNKVLSVKALSEIINEINSKIDNSNSSNDSIIENNKLVSIESIEQSVSSEESGAENIWVVKLTNGESTEIKLRNGIDGESGKSATIYIGNITEGDTPNVTNGGTEHDVVLDFVLPAKETIIEKTVKVSEVKQVYSSEETVIGTWLNNPLFRRVFTGTISDGLKLTETGNIDKLVHQYGNYGVNCKPLPYQFSESDHCILMKVDNDISMTAVGNPIGTEFNITAEYIKTISGDGEINYMNLSTIGYTGEDNEDLVIPTLFVGTDGNVYNVTKIDSGMFNDATNLRSVTIPESVKEIDGYSFQNCTNLQTINIAEGTTNMGKYTFQYCENLTEVNLPNTLTNIDNYTFQYCKSLENIVIPDGVTEIGSWTFQYCENLKEITLPTSLTKINSFAFQYCNNLTTINYKGTKEQYSTINISGMNDPIKNANIVYNYTV